MNNSLPFGGRNMTPGKAGSGLEASGNGEYGDKNAGLTARRVFPDALRSAYRDEAESLLDDVRLWCYWYGRRSDCVLCGRHTRHGAVMFWREQGGFKARAVKDNETPDPVAVCEICVRVGAEQLSGDGFNTEDLTLKLVRAMQDAGLEKEREEVKRVLARRPRRGGGTCVFCAGSDGKRVSVGEATMCETCLSQALIVKDDRTCSCPEGYHDPKDEPELVYQEGTDGEDTGWGNAFDEVWLCRICKTRWHVAGFDNADGKRTIYQKRAVTS